MTKSLDFSLRDPKEGVLPLLCERWSPRAFSGEAIADEVLARVFDAARWAPSCRNEQPWRIYTSNMGNYTEVLSCLDEGNQAWAKTAPVIGFLAGHKSFAHNGMDNPYRDFDCGAAWMAMTIQARVEGLYTHGMGGIYKERAERLFNVGNDYEVIMGFVVGALKPLSEMTEEELSRHVPNARKSLDEVWVGR